MINIRCSRQAEAFVPADEMLVFLSNVITCIKHQIISEQQLVFGSVCQGNNSQTLASFKNNKLKAKTDKNRVLFFKSDGQTSCTRKNMDRASGVKDRERCAAVKRKVLIHCIR